MKHLFVFAALCAHPMFALTCGQVVSGVVTLSADLHCNSQTALRVGADFLLAPGYAVSGTVGAFLLLPTASLQVNAYLLEGLGFRPFVAPGALAYLRPDVGDVGFAPCDLAVGRDGELFIAIGGRRTRGPCPDAGLTLGRCITTKSGPFGASLAQR